MRRKRPRHQVLSPHSSGRVREKWGSLGAGTVKDPPSRLFFRVWIRTNTTARWRGYGSGRLPSWPTSWPVCCSGIRPESEFTPGRSPLPIVRPLPGSLAMRSAAGAIFSATTATIRPVGRRSVWIGRWRPSRDASCPMTPPLRCSSWRSASSTIPISGRTIWTKSQMRSAGTPISSGKRRKGVRRVARRQSRSDLWRRTAPATGSGCKWIHRISLGTMTRSTSRLEAIPRMRRCACARKPPSR